MFNSMRHTKRLFFKIYAKVKVQGVCMRIISSNCFLVFYALGYDTSSQFCFTKSTHNILSENIGSIQFLSDLFYYYSFHSYAYTHTFMYTSLPQIASSNSSNLQYAFQALQYDIEDINLLCWQKNIF
nr:hypothetical protein [Erythrotrichia welwitschii]